MTLTDHDRLIAARTIYGEARGEPREGKIAVARVIHNRATDPEWRYGGPALAGVCLKPWQFSCWNADDPNRARIKGLTIDDPRLANSLAALDEALLGGRVERFAGIYHYKVKSSPAPWASGKQPAFVIGRHEFFRDIDG